MIRYKAITPAKNGDGVPTYDGKTLGVKFDKGVAFFDDMTVDPALGRTAAEIAALMESEFGYTVERTDMNSGAPVEEPEKKKRPAGPKPRNPSPVEQAAIKA